MMIARRRVGLTGRQMADRLKVSPNSVVNWENDTRTPSFLVLDAWAKVCDVDLADLDPDLGDSQIKYCVSNPLEAS